MRPLTRCILLSVSLIALLTPKHAARACGFYIAPGEFRFWLLQPDLTNQPDLTPFFFASRYLYRGDMWLARETYPEKNVEEWYAEVKGKATKKDIDNLLYDTDPQYFFDEQKKLEKENSLMNVLRQPANKDLYHYMVLSKKIEQIAANPDPWGEESIPRQNIQRVFDEARMLREQAKSPFVKFRTAYQLLRLYGYGQADMIGRMYDVWFERVKSKSWIKSAALYQKAVHTDGFEKDYLLSKVFDRGDYNRTPCLVFFSSNKLDSILPFAKNRHERNVLYAMKAFNYPGRSLHYIQNIYRSEPAYKDLPFLLLREINKVEDWLLTNKLTSFGHPAVYGADYWTNYEYLENAMENYANDKLYAQQLYRLLLQMINDKKIRFTAILHLYAAHVCLLLKDVVCSERHLSAAAAARPQERNVQMQIRINRLLLRLEKGFDAQTENEFMSIVNTPATETGIYDADIMKNQLVLYTARKLIQKGDKARGLMLLSRTNRALGELPISYYKQVYQEIEDHAAPADYDKMLHILSKRQKTAFERFVTQTPFRSSVEHNEYYEGDTGYDPQRVWDRNKLLDCKASWYLRHRRLEESFAILKQIPDSFWKQEPYKDYIGGDPFFLNVHHSHRINKEENISLNKKQVVEQMIRLQQLAAGNSSKAAECYFQLANAWYNMSYYGKNWLMVKQWWSDSELFYYARENNLSFKTFFEDYYGCRQARSYYQKALAATTDKKLKTLCYYMVQQCNERDRVYRESLVSDDYWPAINTPAINRKDLKKNGVDAAYYEQLVKECELYQSFIRQYNRKL